MLILFELHPEHNDMRRVKMIYINKHNKATYVQRQKFNVDKAVSKVGDCVDRAFYLDDCLLNEIVPKPEPMHWCKYCKYYNRCLGQGDVKPIFTKRKTLKGLEVIET